MKKQEITIAGKQAIACYCYAVEIAFKEMTGQDINEFMSEAYEAIKAERMPDTKKSIMLIVSSMLSYYQSIGNESPVKDSDIMSAATPIEMGDVLGTIIRLRAEFYQIDETEQPKEEEENASKN